jgi:hypothetical protein
MYIIYTLVLVNGSCELKDSRGHFEALEQNGLLALQANVLGPLHVAAQVPLGKHSAA